MSSLNTVTARNGKFMIGDALVARITQWDLNPTLATSSEWGDSDSGGFTNRAAGRKDATFNAEGKYDTTDEVWEKFKPGDTVEATLWITNTGDLYYYFPRALCLDFNLVINVDTEEVVGWTSNWGADGVYYAPGEDGTQSKTLPA